MLITITGMASSKAHSYAVGKITPNTGETYRHPDVRYDTDHSK